MSAPPQPWIWALSVVTKFLITRSSAAAIPRMTAVIMASSTADAPQRTPGTLDEEQEDQLEDAAAFKATLPIQPDVIDARARR